MAAAGQTKPVGDSVAKVNNEIAVGSDLEFQRRWWRFEHIAWFFLSALLLANLIGVFGRGPLANAKSSSQDGTLRVNYERVERFSTPSILMVQMGPTTVHDGKCQLWVGESLVKGLGNERVIPQPLSTELVNGGLLYTFQAGTRPPPIQFQLQPAAIGITHLPLRVPGLANINLKVFVMP
jgi:hypothetical protein